MKRGFSHAAALTALCLSCAGVALAQDPAPERPARGTHREPPRGGRDRAPKQDEHAGRKAAGHAEGATHGAKGHDSEEAGDVAHDAHAEGHGEHEQPFNFAYGLLGEGDADIEPSLLFRPKGMPVPFLANLLNAAILFGGIYWLGRKGMADALTKRRQRIIQGMDDAAKMKTEATEQLAAYKSKLEAIEADVERLKREMRAAAEAERTNILAEARARRERMERDARLLIQQELEAAHDSLRKDTVRGAIESATRLLTEGVTADDQRRLEREYLGSITQSAFSRGSNERGQA